MLWEIERDENPNTRSGPYTPAAETIMADAEFTWDRVSGLGIRVWGLGFGFSGLGFRVWGLGVGV